MTSIEANPDKIRAILQMQPSQTRKDVQKLTGRISTLNKFVVKLVERNLPFFTVLRVSAKKNWMWCRAAEGLQRSQVLYATTANVVKPRARTTNTPIKVPEPRLIRQSIMTCRKPLSLVPSSDA
jgi:hypothetical protein